MKTCKDCGETKDVDQFAKKKTGKFGVEAICKDCKNEKNGQKRQWVKDYKTDKGCEMCGYKEHPAALQFDHIEPSEKKFNISTFSLLSKERLMKEIKKCRVLCANCHMIHTYDPDFHKDSDKQLELW